MPRVHGLRQRLHQPQWDSLVRTTGTPAVALNATSTLFGSPQIGNLAFTNMTVAGQLASDQTYVVLALRCYLYFDGTNARTFYQQVSNQLFFTLTLGEKPQFTQGAWYHPAGGGVWSGGAAGGNPIFSNGVPSQESILKLARPVVIPVRQAITVSASFFPNGATNILTLINAPAGDDQMCITYVIDGLKTRDVE